MPAPTTALNGTGTITATGESSGLLRVLPKFAAGRLVLGFSGTFSSVVVAVRGRLFGLAGYYPLAGRAIGSNSVVGDSANLALTDSTPAAYEFDASGFDQVEVYVVSGTPTTFTVEERAYPAAAATLPVVAVSVPGQSSFAGAVTVTVANANALAVGPNGATNPTLKVATNGASAATGLSVTSAAAGSGLAIAVISSGTNENLTENAKGAGTITIGGVSTGLVSVGRGSASGLVQSSTKTTINAQNGTPTAAQLLGGYLDHNSQTGAGTLTLDTAANIDTAIPGVATGDYFACTYVNRGNQTVTITTATGLTLRGTAAVPTLKNAVLEFYRTGSGAWDVAITLSA